MLFWILKTQKMNGGIFWLIVNSMKFFENVEKYSLNLLHAILTQVNFTHLFFRCSFDYLSSFSHKMLIVQFFLIVFKRTLLCNSRMFACIWSVFAQIIWIEWINWCLLRQAVWPTKKNFEKKNLCLKKNINTHVITIKIKNNFKLKAFLGSSRFVNFLWMDFYGFDELWNFGNIF